MAEQFPNIVPSARRFTMGDYPSVTYRSLSGTIFKRSFGNKQTGYKLDLEFKNIGDESNLKNDSGTLLLLMRHYNAVDGTLQFFALPRKVFSGLFKLDTRRDSLQEIDTKDKFIRQIIPHEKDDDIKWRYASPPQVTSVRFGISTVSVSLIGELQA